MMPAGIPGKDENMMKKLLAMLLLLMMVFPALAEDKDNRYDAIGDCGFDENTQVH